MYNGGWTEKVITSPECECLLLSLPLHSSRSFRAKVMIIPHSNHVQIESQATSTCLRVEGITNADDSNL
jgi:hypothetical protein